MPLPAFIAFNGLLLCAALSDLWRYRIPNALPSLLALSGLILAFPHSPVEAASRAGSAAIVSAVAGALWLRGLLGGGDLKLMMACALWMPLSGLASFAVALGLASGVQGVAALAISQTCLRTPMASAMRSRVPYALSITVAGLVWSLAH